MQSIAACPIGLDDLFTLEQFAAQFPHAITVAALRWQLRHRDSNGLAPAVVRIGKKLCISKSRYEAWLATQAQS